MTLKNDPYIEPAANSVMTNNVLFGWSVLAVPGQPLPDRAHHGDGDLRLQGARGGGAQGGHLPQHGAIREGGMMMMIVMMVMVMMVVMVVIALLLCISGVSCTFFRFEFFPPQERAGLDKATSSSCRKGLGGCFVNQSIELHFTCKPRHSVNIIF